MNLINKGKNKIKDNLENDDDNDEDIQKYFTKIEQQLAKNK